ncbi:hypothetical protein EYR36_006873 [Pleurotus pulmonarius]|nr:hypothetical protein EYR36_006873 [Pleurotus pulmonarius]KAF4580309.1 hypothetical protein EYR38_003196 [Pleurotus pulmonarius]
MANPLRLAVLLALSFIGIQATSPIPSSEITVKAAQGLRLIELGEDLQPVWKTEDEKNNLILSRTRFFDVTDTYELAQNISHSGDKATEIFYGKPAHQATVKNAIAKISGKHMKENLTVRDIAGKKQGITVFAFRHRWGQNSTIVRFAGKKSAGPITIISAHMDSVMDSVGTVNGTDLMTARAPGADDGGSGTVNLLEAFRVLVEVGFRPTQPVEFHWYSGKEAGMCGSLEIATQYKKTGVHVKGDLQLDMTAFTPAGTRPVAALITNDTNPALTRFVAKLIKEYTKLPSVESKCGSACSDHSSWHKYGYPTAFPFETRFEKRNEAMRTKDDTITAPGFSWNHTREFTKLAVAFAYDEIAHIVACRTRLFFQKWDEALALHTTALSGNSRFGRYSLKSTAARKGRGADYSRTWKKRDETYKAKAREAGIGKTRDARHTREA